MGTFCLVQLVVGLRQQNAVLLRAGHVRCALDFPDGTASQRPLTASDTDGVPVGGNLGAGDLLEL